MFKKILLPLLLLLPFTAQAGLLGLDNEIKGEYNTDTSASTVTAQVGKTIGIYGFSVTGDVDFDLKELEYTGIDFKAENDILEMNSTSFYVSSGLDTDWEMEDITLGMSIKF